MMLGGQCRIEINDKVVLDTVCSLLVSHKEYPFLHMTGLCRQPKCDREPGATENSNTS